ncbi:MAG: glucose-1-phosphate thymidylyltransferase [Candidatus Amoebophilus sp. 36-38]|nr:MAG: glucose-1-phosphate thymidylyltransferase [Candidatus Amoebophilus sp. 36-38]
MKGIILAGGNGTRLYPITQSTSKCLLPIYDKPMIYYPLSVLMMAGIRELLIITTPQDQSAYKRLLGNGNQLGININYAIEPYPRGIAAAFMIAEQFIGNNTVSLVLGDNLLHGEGLADILQQATQLQEGALVFGYYVDQPERYGVIKFGNQQEVVDIIEKPKNPPSNYAVTGIYFYDNSVVAKAKQLQPSARGELEITDINKLYLQEKKLQVTCLGRGTAWLDTGQPDALREASDFIAVIEHRQGLKIGCIEEIAFKKGYIHLDQLKALALPLQQTAYGDYLLRVATEKNNYADN